MTQHRDRAWDEAMEWVFRLAESPRDPLLRDSLEHWLAADPANARAYGQARLIWDAAPALRPAPAAAPTRRRFLVSGGALAAGLALTLGNWKRLENLRADHATAVGERRTVSVTDGLRLTLNTDSALRVHPTEDGPRLDLLRGEVFVQSRLPLDITLGDTLVSAQAGALNLRRADPAPAVTVEQGGAMITLAGFSETVHAGQEAAWDEATGSWQRRAAEREAAPWRDGRLVVGNWPVARVLAELERYHPGRIVLTDGTLGTQMVNGVYDLARPTDAVRAVALAFGATVREVTPYLLVVTPA